MTNELDEWARLACVYPHWHSHCSKNKKEMLGCMCMCVLVCLCVVPHSVWRASPIFIKCFFIETTLVIWTHTSNDDLDRKTIQCDCSWSSHRTQIVTYLGALQQCGKNIPQHYHSFIYGKDYMTT